MAKEISKQALQAVAAADRLLSKTEKPLYEQICDASSEVLRAADILVGEYERPTTQKAMSNAEDQLTNAVKAWRKITGG